jgi:hypothetical protein
MGQPTDILNDVNVSMSAGTKTVAISNPVVSNGLFKEQQITLEELARIAAYPSAEHPTAVRLSDVSIDSNGNVIIHDAAYAEAMSQMLATGLKSLNIFC